jgi:hypothetical protein
MRIHRWVSIGCLYALFSGSAIACFCFSNPMCSSAATPSDSSAVFVGSVVEVWPSREVVARQQGLSHSRLKQLILQRWHGVLSKQEEQYIRASSEWDKVEFRYAYMQRVRFVVREVLAGPRVREVFTDSTSCGYSFELNRLYFVNSSRDGLRFRTGACARTAPAESEEAIEDLKALHTWKSGTPLSPRIYGRILPSDNRPDVLVRVARDRDEGWVHPDAGGGFSFDGLEKARYRLQVRDQRGAGERLIDLTPIGCFEATPWFDDSWHIGGSPALSELSPREAP